MADYLIYALDSGGLAVTRHTVRCETDDQARLACRGFLPLGGVAELWSGRRCVDHVSVAFVERDARA